MNVFIFILALKNICTNIVGRMHIKSADIIGDCTSYTCCMSLHLITQSLSRPRAFCTWFLWPMYTSICQPNRIPWDSFTLSAILRSSFLVMIQNPLGTVELRKAIGNCYWALNPGQPVFLLFYVVWPCIPVEEGRLFHGEVTSWYYLKFYMLASPLS